MALLFMDGFETGELGAGGWVNGLSAAAVSTTYPRKDGGGFGGSYYLDAGTTGQLYITSPTFGPTTNAYIAFGLRLSSSPGASVTVLQVLSGVSVLAQLQVNTAAQLILTSGSGGTAVIGTSSLSIVPGQWYWVVVKCYAGVGTAVLGVQVDGVQWIGDLASQNTNSLTTWNNFKLGCGNISSGVGHILYDDVACWDTTGSVNIGYSPPAYIVGQAPNADVAAGWARSGGANNYGNVDVVPAPDNMTNYVSAATAGVKDVYGTASALGNATTILGVTEYIYCSQGVGLAHLNAGVRISGVDYNSPSSPLAVPASAGWVRNIMELNPATSAQWTQAAANGVTVQMSSAA